MTKYRLRSTENEAQYRYPPADGVFQIPITKPYSGNIIIEIISPNGVKTQTESLYVNLTLNVGDVFKFTLGKLLKDVPEKAFAL